MSRKTRFSISRQLFDAGVKLPHESVWVQIPRTQVSNPPVRGNAKLVPAGAKLWADLDVRYPAYDATELLDALPHHLFINQQWFDLKIKKDFQSKDSPYQEGEIGPFYRVGYYTTDHGGGRTWSIVQEQGGNSLEVPLALVLLELLEKSYATHGRLQEQLDYLKWQNFGEPVEPSVFDEEPGNDSLY